MYNCSFLSSGKPSAPVTDSVGRQVRLSKASTGSVVVGRANMLEPPQSWWAQGKRL